MQRVELEVQPRELRGTTGDKNLNQLRRDGWVPGTLYGNGKPASFAVEYKTFAKALHNKAGANALFNVKYGGETALAVIKEIQRHLLKHTPIHVDFQRIDTKKKLEISVPVHVIGDAPGVKNSGGILEHITREIRVRCLPDDIPASIDMDVTKLELGHGIKVRELPPINGVEFLTLAETIIVNVVAPKVEEVVVATPAVGAPGATPEVIAKGKKDEEGAAPAAAGEENRAPPPRRRKARLPPKAPPRRAKKKRRNKCGWWSDSGNPGPSYEETRHNVGRDFVSSLSRLSAGKFSKQRQAEVLRLPSFFAARLSCFMNESGGPIKTLLAANEQSPEQLLVVVDDFMIPFGTLRLRPGGSSGGHNGLKSIIAELGTDEFPRLRVGVGPVREFQDPKDFVLERFSKTERAALPVMYKAIEDAIAKIESDGIEKAMNWTNKSHLQ